MQTTGVDQYLPPHKFLLHDNDQDSSDFLTSFDTLIKKAAEKLSNESSLPGTWPTKDNSENKDQFCKFLGPLEIVDDKKIVFKPETTDKLGNGKRDAEDQLRFDFQSGFAKSTSGFRPAALEDILCRLLRRGDGSVDTTALGFDPTLRSKLQEAMKKNPPVLSPELVKSIEQGLQQGQFQPQLQASLQLLLKGQLSGDPLQTLTKQLAEQGLFTKEVFRAAVEKEKNANSWGAMSQAAFIDTADSAVKRGNGYLQNLTAADYKYLPSGWGIQIPPGQTLEQFKADVLSGKNKIALPFDEGKPPTKQTCENLMNVCLANGEAQLQRDAGARVKSYDVLESVLKRMGREQWIPTAKKEAYSPEWERRLKETAAVTSLFEQVDGTRKQLEMLRQLRMPGGGGGWQKDLGEVFNGKQEMATKYLDDAYRTLPRDKNGSVLMPDTLNMGTDDKESMRKLQAWLDANRQRVNEEFSKVMDHVLKGNMVCYGDRPKVEGSDPAGDYNLVRDRCKVTKQANGDLKVEMTTTFMKSDWLYDLDATQVLPPKPNTFIVKPGELIPVVDYKAGTLALIESQQLETYLNSESSAKKAGIAVDIGLDLAMLYTGGKAILAPAELAAKEVAQQVVKSMLRRTFERMATRSFLHGVTDVVLGGSGVVLNSAHARWEDPDLAFLAKARGVAFVFSAGAHVASASGKAVGYFGNTSKTAAEGAKALEKAGAATGEAGKAAGEAGKAVEAGKTAADAGKAVEAGKAAADAGKAVEAGKTVADAGKGVEAVKAAEAAEKAKTWSELSTIGKALRVGKWGVKGADVSAALGMGATQFYFLPQMAHDFAGHFGPGNRNLTSALEKLTDDDAANTKKQSVNNSGAEGFDKKSGPSKLNTFLESAALTLGNGKGPDVIESIDKTVELAAKLRDLPKDSKEREPVAQELAARFKSGSPEQKLAACVGLVESAIGADMKLNQTAGGIPVDQLLRYLRDEMSATKLDTKETSPERALVAARARLLVEDMDGREYTHLCDSLIGRPDVSDSAKMQALIGLGLSMWSAENAEKGFSTQLDEQLYWANSHGVSRADLQKRLTDIANGTVSNTTVDQKTLAAALLHAFSRSDEQKRIALLGTAIKDYAENMDKPGAFTSAFVARMSKDMNFELADNNNYTEAKGRQFMAASVLSQLKVANDDPVLKNRIADTLAGCVNDKVPGIAKQALEALAASGMAESQDPQDKNRKNRVALSAINIILGNNGDRISDAHVDLKLAAMRLLPHLVQGTDFSRQAESAVASLIKPGANYAAQYPELRLMAVETLGRLGSARAEEALRGLLKFNADKPSEPSVSIRIAAYQALSKLIPLENPERNNEFKAFLKAQAQLEREPRANAVLTGLMALREQRPVPLNGEKFDAQKITDKFPALKSKGQIDSYKAECSAFVGKDCPQLDAKKYKENMEKHSPNYDDGLHGAWMEIKDSLGYTMATGNGWAPGANKGPRDYRKEERDQIKYDYLSGVKKLMGSALGMLESGAPVEKTEQLKAVHALAYLIKHEGKIDDKECFVNSIADSAWAAKCLAAACSMKIDPEVRAQAKDALIELLQTKDLNPRIREQLVKGVGYLFDFGADELSADKRSQALLSKEEASALIASTLSIVRSGRLPENGPAPQDPEQLKAWKLEVDASRRMQIDLMKKLVWCHQNRQCVNLMQEVQNSPDAELKAAAKECVDRTYGVAVRNNYYGRHYDEGKSAADRALDMQNAIAKVTDKATAYEAVDAILRATYGETLTGKDPRLDVLRSALNHENDSVRLAAAFACLTKMSDTLPGDAYGSIYWPAIRTLADLSAFSNNPSVKFEATTKLETLEKRLTDQVQSEGNRLAGAKNYPDKDEAKQKANVAALEQKLNAHEKILAELKGIKTNAAATRAGFNTVLQSVMRSPQSVTAEARSKWLESVTAGTADGDPVRTIFNACFDLNPTPPNGGSKWKQLAADDPRLPMLRKLLESKDARVSAAAGMMLSYFSPQGEDRVNGLKRLDALRESGAKPVSDELGFHLVELHGMRAVTDIKIKDIDQAERNIDAMLRLDREVNPKEMGQRCRTLLKSQTQLLKAVNDAAKASNDQVLAAKTEALIKKITTGAGAAKTP
jgi:hypothetical protein